MTVLWFGLREYAWFSSANSMIPPSSRANRTPVLTSSESFLMAESSPRWNEETWKPERSHPLSTASSMCSRAGPAVPSPFSSMFMPILPVARSMTSWRVGILSPLPASSTLSSSRVIFATSPVPSVVLSTVSSWMTTSSPEPQRWTSSSTMSAPSSIALLKDLSVFSGSWPAAPRWPTLTTMG